MPEHVPPPNRPPLRSPSGGVIPPPGTAPTGAPNLQPPGGRRPAIEAQYRSAADSRAWGIGIALVLLVGVAFALVLWPPSGEDKTAVVSTTDGNTNNASTAATPVADTDPGVSRAQAQAALQAALQRQAELEVLRAPAWAEAEWADLLATMTAANEAFQRGGFAAAKHAWQQAEAGFSALRDARPEHARQHLAAADAALAADQAAPAEKAYDAALAANPDSAPARAGLERARQRPALLAALRDAQTAEDGGDLAAAATAYQRAIELDRVDPRGRDGLQRVAIPLADARFKAAMGEALQALDRKRFADARKALEVAAQQRPNDPAVADLRRRIAADERVAGLAALRREAQAAVAREDWAAAARSYQAAMKIDPDAGFARDGLAQAQARETLHAQIDHYLARPERLYGKEPLHNAELLLKAAGSGGEPGLKAKLERLRKLVEVASTPLTVTLRSDGQTEVVIYHLARLGRFQELGLELNPGDYTAVGSRDGYRDVRRVFQVRPGVPTPPISLRCTEAL